MSDAATHWESVYGKKRPDEVSWYRPHLERSLAFIEGAGLAKDASIIDVGAGASTLLDDLVAHGYSNLTALDVSAKALDVTRARLGPAGDAVRYSADGLHAEFGGEFRKVDSVTEVHRTPGGNDQQFVYCYCRLGG